MLLLIYNPPKPTSVSPESQHSSTHDTQYPNIPSLPLSPLSYRTLVPPSPQCPFVNIFPISVAVSQASLPSGVALLASFARAVCPLVLKFTPLCVFGGLGRMSSKRNTRLRREYLYRKQVRFWRADQQEREIGNLSIMGGGL